MQRYYTIIRDAYGNAAAGVSVAVYTGGTTTLTTIYDPTQGDTPTTSITNPIITGADGRVAFAAPDGDYDLYVSGPGLTSFTMSRINLLDGSTLPGAYTGIVDVAHGGTGLGTLGTGLLRGNGTSNVTTGATVNLATEVTGNLSVNNLNGGNGANNTTFWRGDGTWVTPAGAGTVTSVAAQYGIGTTSGAAITGTGTLQMKLGKRAVAGSSDTILAADRGGLVTFTNTGAIAVTLPQAGTAGFESGFAVWIENTASSALTITPTTSTVDASATLVLLKGTGVLLVSDGTNYFTMRGMVPTATQVTWTASNNVASVALTPGATVNTDATLGNVFTLTAGSNFTLANPTGLVAGGRYVWVIKQDATGSRVITWGSAFKFPASTDKVLTPTPNAVDYVEGVSDGTSVYCSILWKNLA